MIKLFERPLLDLLRTLSAGLLLTSAFLPSVAESSVQQPCGTAKGLVLVGYQGWFRCPGDGSPANTWSHWSKGAPSPDTMAVDLYPDTSELDSKSLCKLPDATIDGQPAYIFSSYRKETVETHFAWMQQYGIDGALAQRFINSTPGLKREGDAVLHNIRSAAEDHGRKFAVEYDLSGAHLDTVFAQLQDDWSYLQRDGFVSSNAYLRLNGKPVVAIWGLGFGDGHHIVDPVLALKIIRSFQQQGAAVVGGTPSGWGSLSGDSTHDPNWARVYAALDVVQPWTVGRYNSPEAADHWKTSHLEPDVALTQKNHQLYMPVIFPGFSWHNLKPESPANQIPRLGGEFFWRQAYNARTAGACMVKIAMFDEVNEGTAILKAAPRRADAPKPGYWLTLDADNKQLPSDFYLQLATQIKKMFSEETTPSQKLLLKPGK
jgi:hypothetical protein